MKDNKNKTCQIYLGPHSAKSFIFFLILYNVKTSEILFGGTWKIRIS
jgi:hypothetical protein